MTRRGPSVSQKVLRRLLLRQHLPSVSAGTRGQSRSPSVSRMLMIPSGARLLRVCRAQTPSHGTFIDFDACSGGTSVSRGSPPHSRLCSLL